MRAAIIPAPLAAFRQGPGTGTVLAVFDRSAYLQLDGRIIALASADLGRGPLTITLSEDDLLPTLVVGMPASIESDRLHLGPAVIDLQEAIVWDPRLPAVCPAPPQALAASRELAIGQVLGSAPEESSASLLSPTPARTPLLNSLSAGLRALRALLEGEEDPAPTLAAIAREAAGRGPGLTPSGDDMLAGAMMALLLWPSVLWRGEARALCAMLVENARPRTTQISGAYLEAAARGLAAEPWHALMRSLGGPLDETRAAVHRILCVGETSGADMLTGFCWVWRRAFP
jgi:hypothetical protein